MTSLLDVYIAEIPSFLTEFTALYPVARNNEVVQAKNPDVKRHKYYVWRLLEIAVSSSFCRDIETFSFYKSENGKWLCNDFYFSLSHSGNYVAVALSDKPVGVDIQSFRKLCSSFAERILTADELFEYSKLPQCDKKDFVFAAWTKKEAIFKMMDKSSFIAANTDIGVCGTLTKQIKASDGEKYMLSVACDNIADAKIIKIYCLKK